MILHCHGRLRVPDDSGQRYMPPCYTCARHDTHFYPDGFLRIKPPVFETGCPQYLPKPERNEAEESWSEER